MKNKLIHIFLFKIILIISQQIKLKNAININNYQKKTKKGT